MADWQVIVEVSDAQEAEVFSVWLERWRGRVVVSENEGCGCCVDIWQISGPADAKAELPEKLISFSSPGSRTHEESSRPK